MAVVKQHVIGI